MGGYVATSPLIGYPIHAYAAVLLALGLLASFMRSPWFIGTGWILALWFMFSLSVMVHPPTTAYGREKVLELFTAVLVAVAAPLWLARSGKRHRALLWALFVFSVGITILAILFPENSWRLSLLGTNYIGSGRIIGDGSFNLSLLAFVIKVGPRLLTLGLAAASGYFTLLSGSRAPFIAACIAVIVIICFRHAVTQRGLRVAGDNCDALGVTIYFAVNALVSGDIIGNRVVFSLLILGWTMNAPTEHKSFPRRKQHAFLGTPHPLSRFTPLDAELVRNP